MSGKETESCSRRPRSCGSHRPVSRQSRSTDTNQSIQTSSTSPAIVFGRTGSRTIIQQDYEPGPPAASFDGVWVRVDIPFDEIAGNHEGFAECPGQECGCSVFGRAVVVAGAVVVALGSSTGAAAAQAGPAGTGAQPRPLQLRAGRRRAGSLNVTLANAAVQATEAGTGGRACSRRGRVHPHRRNLPQPGTRRRWRRSGLRRTRRVRDGRTATLRSAAGKRAAATDALTGARGAVGAPPPRPRPSGRWRLDLGSQPQRQQPAGHRSPGHTLAVEWR